MLNGKKILGIIPARGGSKRVPFKNITLFRGKPLIQWVLEQAGASKYLDAYIVSTEDAAISKHAKERILWRPDFLAEDKVPTEAVVLHTLYTMPGYDFACVLQPTSPLRSVEDIDRCIEIAVQKHGLNGQTGCVSYNPFGKRNGAVYVCNSQHFMQYLSFDAAHHYEMPMERSLDIDYTWDFDANPDRQR